MDGTRGVEQGVNEEIYAVLRTQRERGRRKAQLSESSCAMDVLRCRHARSDQWTIATCRDRNVQNLGQFADFTSIGLGMNEGDISADGSDAEKIEFGRPEGQEKRDRIIHAWVAINEEVDYGGGKRGYGFVYRFVHIILISCSHSYVPYASRSDRNSHASRI